MSCTSPNVVPSSCQALISTLPPWMTLLSFSSFHVVAPSMESPPAPCQVFLRHVPQPCYHCCYLLKDYHYVAFAHINKSSIDHSTLLMYTAKTAQQSDFEFFLYTYHVNDSTLHAACINITDLCIASENIAIPNRYTYSGSSISSNSFFGVVVQKSHA